ncbi:MAG TPA: type II secretion system protein N [Methylomirabilota bacterium]
MPKPLLALNAAFAVASVLLLGYIVRQVTAPRPRPLAARAPAPAAAVNPIQAGIRPPAAAYAAVASRNLFSPTRSEAATQPSIANAPMNAPRPNLFGVILRDGAPVAYLEDPTTKRVAGYRVGDNVGGGTVQSIAADHVVLARPDGNVNVQLHDPTRPRPAPVAPAPAVGGVVPIQPPPPAGAMPGQAIPQPGAPYIPQPMPTPGAVGQQAPDPAASTRRPLPNLLRRMPQGGTPGAGDDAQR